MSQNHIYTHGEFFNNSGRGENNMILTQSSSTRHTHINNMRGYVFLLLSKRTKHQYWNTTSYYMEGRFNFMVKYFVFKQEARVAFELGNTTSFNTLTWI